MPLVSVITPTLNSEDTIEACIESVNDQLGVTIEHLVVDGSSTDKTRELVDKFNHITCISEPDNGIYDAINKGLRLSSGEFIAICHSNDRFIASNALQKLVDNMQRSQSDFSYADCIYFSGKRMVRYYKSGALSEARLSYGLAPAHTTLVIRRSILKEIGFYSEHYPICGDFEYFVRLRHNSYSYIEEPLVAMSTGGASRFSCKNAWSLSNDLRNVLREHGINTNLLKLFTRYPVKKISSQLYKTTRR